MSTTPPGSKGERSLVVGKEPSQHSFLIFRKDFHLVLVEHNEQFFMGTPKFFALFSLVVRSCEETNYPT
jgi:hypothetical protein